ncbi:Uncharacterised protein [Vibrio cholerae]|nr:Uncharacterised protein [Vibrio cholerae]CSI43382.1 Uncharacterised protein [Vibrio cholerae]CSI55193.1 Uncharacterised protein [Vibrio cholerae]
MEIIEHGRDGSRITATKHDRAWSAQTIVQIIH